MGLKNKIKKFAQNVYNVAKTAGKGVIYTAPFWLPGALEAKALNLQATKEAVTTEYENAAWVKTSKNGSSFHAGTVLDIGKGYHLDAGVGNYGAKVAALGKGSGIEASTDFKGNKSLTLDGMVAGIGLSATGNLDSEGKKTVEGSIFRAEKVGKGYLYGKIGGNKDNADVSGLGLYIGPKIGNTTVIPLVYGSKSLTSKGYYFMTGAVFSAGKVSTGITAGTTDLTDFKSWTPSVKVKVKF